MVSTRRLSVLVAGATMLLLAFGALARPLPGTRPERVGLDPERLARISAVMNDAVADGTMVGGLGMIARNGRVAYTQSWGLKNREADLPMTEDTIFRIYSMSKPITGVALMMLYEEGRFFLNDPVASGPLGKFGDLREFGMCRGKADPAAPIKHKGKGSNAVSAHAKLPLRALSSCTVSLFHFLSRHQALPAKRA